MVCQYVILETIYVGYYNTSSPVDGGNINDTVVQTSHKGFNLLIYKLAHP